MDDEQLAKDNMEFAAAFGGGEEPNEADQLVADDDAGGLSVNAAAEAEAEAEGETPAVEAAEEASAEGETPEVEAAENQSVDAAIADPKLEEQRLKSWAGRLKAREKELAKQAEMLKSGAHPVQAQDEGQSATEKVESAIESIEGMPEDEAYKSLSADFGEEFAKALIKIIDSRSGAVAGRMVKEQETVVSGRVDELINAIKNDKVREHFEAIQAAHPDFDEVRKTPEFAAYLQQNPKLQEIAKSGTARQSIKLLDDFKKSTQKPAEEPQTQSTAVAAAEGVRSRGLRIPDKPNGESFEAAWKEFAG